jgi:hypothetical protein
MVATDLSMERVWWFLLTALVARVISVQIRSTWTNVLSRPDLERSLLLRARQDSNPRPAA